MCSNFLTFLIHSFKIILLYEHISSSTSKFAIDFITPQHLNNDIILPGSNIFAAVSATGSATHNLLICLIIKLIVVPTAF